MLAKLLTFVTEAKKAAVGVVGFAVLLIATGALTGNVLHVAQGVVALGTVLGIYKATNAPAAYGEGEGVLD